MEEETISMTMEEDNNQYNPIEIKDNKIYNNYVMSIENEEAKDDKEFTKGEKKRLVEKEEENSKKEKKNKRIRRIIEVVKEKEEMKKEIQIKVQVKE
ncbi:hypothetical protein ENUP19_0108G0027 [Entamoeba nuttalli]|uniref:Uncharacterized protein n=1 Tax=Entamoeba nuttalli TaxID=412467 RepID=A0ABQ0DHU1_9EUKA